MIGGGKHKRKRLTKITMQLANIGEKYWPARLEDVPEDYECRETLMRYVDLLVPNIKDGTGLLLYGPKGHGKTHIAISILKKALCRYASGLFLPVNRIQEIVIEKPTLAFADGEEISLFDKAREADMLVLDDMGEEYTKVFNVRILEHLIRYRDTRNRPTIFTTNLDPKAGELDKLYGDWATSVLKGMALPLRVKGVDWRAKQAAEIQKRFER